MPKFKLKITTDNDAFCPDPRIEIARILRRLADQLENYSVLEGGYLIDINGNRVGEWDVWE